MCERIDDVRRVVLSETGRQYRRVVHTALGRWVVCGGWWCGGLESEVMVEVAVCFLSASEEATLINGTTGSAASVGVDLSALRCALFCLALHLGDC